MKKSSKILIALLAVIVGLVLARGVIARTAVSVGVKKVTGLPLSIRSLDIGLFQPVITAKGITVMNPAGFPDRTMVEMPLLSVNYNLGAFLTGKTHLQELELDLQQLTVVKSKQGKLNLDSLTAVQKAKEEEKAAAKPNLKIDHLHLKIGKVIYKDYSAGEKPSVQEFAIHLDEEYRDITDPTALGSLIVARALFNTTIAGLAHFDLGAVNDQVRNILKDPLGKAGRIGSQTVDTAAGLVENTFDRLKKVIE